MPTFHMKKQLFGFLILLSLVASLPAQKADVTETNLRKHIAYLASDALEGRRTGEQGATVAAGYIANQFAKLRLKPGAKSKNGKPNYLQPFPYVTGVELTKENNTLHIDATEADGRPTVLGSQAWAVGF